MIAAFFLGPLFDPRRNAWVVLCGLLACGGVILLATIAGAFRGIPLWWRLVDCSFGVACAIPLVLAWRGIRRLEALQHGPAAPGP